MSKKVATLEKVSKMYGKDELIVKALDNVNLEIYKGDYWQLWVQVVQVKVLQ